MRILEYNIGTGARAFSTMRGGGSGNYGGFNITHYCGDAPEHVAACREELCRMLGITDSRLLLPRQTHGSEVLCIDTAFMELPQEEQQTRLYGVDAIVTSLPRTCIGVSTADCRLHTYPAARHTAWGHCRHTCRLARNSVAHSGKVH